MWLRLYETSQPYQLQLRYQGPSGLITALLGVPPHPTLSQLLWKQSEGNPFFLEELLREWLRTEVLHVSPEHATLSSSPPGNPPVSISGLIRYRFARLPQEVLETLHTAAILGRTFASSFLAEVMGQDEEVVEEHLLTAVMDCAAKFV